MEQSFKRIADSVCLSESSRTRIRAQIAFRAEEQEASMQNNSKNIYRGWRWPRSSLRRR